MCLSSSCTPAVLDSIACADQECHSCKARILWLMSESGGSLTQIDACNLVALEEFPDECGGCGKKSPFPIARKLSLISLTITDSYNYFQYSAPAERQPILWV